VWLAGFSVHVHQKAAIRPGAPCGLRFLVEIDGRNGAKIDSSKHGKEGRDYGPLEKYQNQRHRGKSKKELDTEMREKIQEPPAASTKPQHGSH
jgi:hypothetical protein